MKIIIAPDKFKGSCTAPAAARAIGRGWLSVFPGDTVTHVPVADGGEGTLEAMHAACGGEFMRLSVTGPLGDAVDSRWLRLPDGTAVIEMAQASGLHLVERRRRDVRRATTYGTGELLRAALDAGCRSVVLGIGGSATNDGGLGLLRALGARFTGAGREIAEPGALPALDAVDLSGLDARLRECSVAVACDVANPLCGPEGASAVFGPQKGASADDVRHMDACLGKLAAVVAGAMGFDRSGEPGAGAAGGLGWALLQCCGARMRPGIDVVLDAVGFDGLLAGAGLVITGEGSMDAQTAMGKVPVGVAARAGKCNVPVAAVAGTLGRGHEAVFDLGVDCALGIAPGPMVLEDAMKNAEQLIEQAAARLARAVKLGMRIGAATK